ncbi:MAG: Dam family site-specific DNA-(adenine-N6)-methyltransferase [Proteobacteria bacterium]|nr:Dam family site-specific DNA-(adenine-N6)-methyltransferase [Pseudomonadota bacterium]
MKPFLKWAGNKYRIIDRIKKALPPANRLIEPFTGSAAVFLNTNYSNYLLAEKNDDLINLYHQLKDEGEKFIKYCRKFFEPGYNNRERYYELREQFNQTKNIRLRSALFIYFNKHGYNGLCRYNTSGKFNVPFGLRDKTNLPELEMRFFLEKAHQASFIQADFLETMDRAKSGDVVYCDPPYAPLSKTANFTGYSSGGFSEKEQALLADEAKKLSQKGITVVISNHDTKFTRELYKGAKITSFEVPRYISRDGYNRHPALELLAVFSGKKSRKK